MFLGIVELCNDYALANILSIIQKVMTIMQIIVPIIAIIALVKLLTKLLVDPENKKLKTGFKNWLIVFIMFFFLPFIINAVMGMLDQNYSIASCWNYARNYNNTGDKANYNNSYDDSQTKVVE